MKMKSIRLVIAASALLAAAPASAQDTIKVGFVAEFSGMFADLGRSLDNGVKLYVKLHGDTIAGKKVEVINRDVGGPLPDGSLAGEVVTCPWHGSQFDVRTGEVVHDPAVQPLEPGVSKAPTA